MIANSQILPQGFCVKYSVKLTLSEIKTMTTCTQSGAEGHLEITQEFNGFFVSQLVFFNRKLT